MNETFSIDDILLKLIGETLPYGETYTDKERFKNQELLIHVSSIIIDTLERNSKFHNRTEYSIKKIGNSALEYLKELKLELDYVIE